MENILFSEAHAMKSNRIRLEAKYHYSASSDNVCTGAALKGCTPDGMQ